MVFSTGVSSPKGEPNTAPRTRHSLIVLDNMYSGYEFDTAVNAARKEKCFPNVVHTARSPIELLSRVAFGQGVAVMSEKYRPMGNGQVAFVPLKDSEINTVYMIWRNDGNPCIAAIWDLLEKNG